MSEEKARTDRIDFELLVDGKVIVTKMYTSPDGMKDIPHESTVYQPGEFDVQKALTWCRENNFSVFTWPPGKPPIGARAWRGHPRPVRTAHQIIKLRRELTTQAGLAVYSGLYAMSSENRGWDYKSLHRADLAFVAEPNAAYNHTG